MAETFQQQRGLRRLVNAFRYSLQGLAATYRHEEAFRLEVWSLPVLVPLAVWLADSALELAALLGAVLFVMIVELLNTAVESAIDRIGSEPHPLSGRAKDQASAAVLLAIVLAAGVWLAVLVD